MPRSSLAWSPHEPAVAYWAVAVPGAVTFIAALLAHELAHCLVARRYGAPVTSITLWALGGVSELGGEPPHARADLLIAVAGPATSLAAGLVLGGISQPIRTTMTRTLQCAPIRMPATRPSGMVCFIDPAALHRHAARPADNRTGTCPSSSLIPPYRSRQSRRSYGGGAYGLALVAHGVLPRVM